jgi:hypothetical protein
MGDIDINTIADEDLTAVIVEFLDAGDWPLLLRPESIERVLSAVAALRIALEREASRLHGHMHTVPSDNAKRTARRSIAQIKSRQRQLRILTGQAVEVKRRVAQGRQAALEEAARVRKEASRIRIRSDHAAHSEQQLADTREAVRQLTLAIQRHRLAAVEAALTPEPADRQLWSILDEVKVPYGTGVATLTEMLGSSAWREQVTA